MTNQEVKSEHISDSDPVPTCFDRAESGGQVFDNCRFYNVCGNVNPACFNSLVE